MATIEARADHSSFSVHPSCFQVSAGDGCAAPLVPAAGTCGLSYSLVAVPPVPNGMHAGSAFIVFKTYLKFKLFTVIHTDSHIYVYVWRAVATRITEQILCEKR